MSLKIRRQLKSDTPYKFAGRNPRTYITVHETGNPSHGANAAAHANLQSRGNPAAVSWHWQVDDREAVQSFAHTFRLWHAGDGSGHGNMSSIAIETCINSDGNWTKTRNNLVDLIVYLMRTENVPLSRVVQHNYWSGKNCPTKLRANNNKQWKDIISRVSRKISGNSPSKPPSVKPETKTIAELADEVLAGKHGNGEDRKRSLGSRYEAVQAEVNRILAQGNKTPSKPRKSDSKLADEVMAGKHGNGEQRKQSLGSRYNAVQAIVNQRLGIAGAHSRNIDELADAVMAGKYGNGEERKRRLGSAYQAVQNEVNRRLYG